MKKTIISILVLVIWTTSLYAQQITRGQADTIVKEYLQNKNAMYSILYVNTNEPKEEGITIKTFNEEIFRAKYACWAYYLNESEFSRCRYLFVKENNGNLLEVIANNDLGQEDTTQWKIIPFITRYSASFCEGGIYTDDNFTNLTQAGVYYDTLQNANGGDGNIIELTLIVDSIYFTQISDSISAGDSCNFHGKLLTENGIYYDTLQTIHGCDSIIELTLTVTSVGIEQMTIENGQLKIYPNPTNGQLIIEIVDQAHNDVERMEIFDVIGCEIPTLKGGIFENKITIDISHLANGLYFLKIYGINKQVSIFKITTVR